MAKGGIQELALGRKDILRMDPISLHIKEGWNCREVTFDPAVGTSRYNAGSLMGALEQAAEGRSE